jgi:phosphoglycerol transferase MdoB-like AlkP superfamily enzyme
VSSQVDARPLEEQERPAEQPPEARSGRVPSRGRRARIATILVVFSLFWAGFCNAVLDLLQAGGGVARFVTYELDEARFIFMISSAIVWLFLVGVWALTNRLRIASAMLLVAVTVVGFADYEKIRLRHEPLYPSDLVFAGNAGFLKEMVGPRVLATVGVLLILELVVVLLAGRILARSLPRVRRTEEPRRWRAVLVVRAVTLVAVLACFVYLSTFNSGHNRVRAAYESAGAHWAFWFQTVNYARHGFVAGFMYNLNVPAMRVPADYSARTMDALATKYETKAATVNQGRDGAALDDVNVVVVLSEAFSDPTRLDGPTVSEDPIPFTRSLMSRTTSGTMLAQLFGGGTANMEFEALSGLSLSQFLPQMNTPYQMLVTDTPTFPSAVGYFKEHGHEPVAVHPYMTSMYKRYAVYPTLGFDRFIHDTTMQKAQRIDRNDFISDKSAFDEVEHQIATADKPALVNLITMQNHYPMADKYDDPIPVGGVTGETADEFSNYARGLKHSDDALRDFITDLKGSDEKTAVIFYGDHEPAFWDPATYDRNGDTRMRETPFFIWTNFKNLPPGGEAPLTSPIYFLPTLFDEVGAALPPYYVLLDELHAQIPAMEQGEYFLPDGSKVSYDGLSPKAKAVLHDYRLVQYDLAVGGRYSQSRMFYEDPSH